MIAGNKHGPYPGRLTFCDCDLSVSSRRIHHSDQTGKHQLVLVERVTVLRLPVGDSEQSQSVLGHVAAVMKNLFAALRREQPIVAVAMLELAPVQHGLRR